MSPIHKHVIDLRSDTVTKPTPDMLEAMMTAEVGDDVFNEDPTVIKLQQKAALMFGCEAALFCPSGTMTNQIAIRVLTQPQDELICDIRSHIYNYEGGGIAYNSLVSVCLVDGDRGRMRPEHITGNIRSADIYSPVTSLVCIENTVNKGGGSYYHLDQLEDIHRVSKLNKLRIHLDGARIFNALVETGDQPEQIGRLFDTISICLSKGLGAPVGSLLMSSEENIIKARRIRKVLGGAMRQAGYMAAAGLFALEHHIDRLKEDHTRARIIGETLGKLAFVEEVLPVDTNIVIFRLAGDLSAKSILGKLQEAGLMGVPFGKKEIRFVTHLNFDDDMLHDTLCILRKLNPE
ncbi:MAG: threonine aldolase [Cyclobacteriaceae bacterium]|nr:threonine aldolase [Cyclobacteriaceae bacterium]